MYKYLFVGEERSETAKRMNVTWRDKRLCAGHLFKALESIGISQEDCEFKNVFEDNIDEIIGFNGTIIGMGRKVERKLIQLGIKHEFIFHPATRGTVRKIENYKEHVKTRIQHIV